MEITIKMDDLGVPLFLETLIYYNKKSPSFTGNQKDLSAVSSQSCEWSTEGSNIAQIFGWERSTPHSPGHPTLTGVNKKGRNFRAMHEEKGKSVELGNLMIP